MKTNELRICVIISAVSLVLEVLSCLLGGAVLREYSTALYICALLWGTAFTLAASRLLLALERRELAK